VIKVGDAPGFGVTIDAEGLARARRA